MLSLPPDGTRGVQLPGKRDRRGDACASFLSSSRVDDALPKASVVVNGVRRSVLVDSGCTRCIAHVSCCDSWTKRDVRVIAVNGESQQCLGTAVVSLQAGDVDAGSVDVLVVDYRPLGFDFILGMNAISALGGVTVCSSHDVKFGPLGQMSPSTGASPVHTSSPVQPICCSAITVDEPDFTASFDAEENAWTVKWKWSNGHEPGVLKNKIPEYAVPDSARNEYENELEEWIENGILLPYDEQVHGEAKGLIPLMAVVQQNKEKVRPVLDFRELNSHVDALTQQMQMSVLRSLETGDDRVKTEQSST